MAMKRKANATKRTNWAETAFYPAPTIPDPIPKIASALLRMTIEWQSPVRSILWGIDQPEFFYVVISSVCDVKVALAIEGQPVGSKKSRGKLGEVCS